MWHYPLALVAFVCVRAAHCHMLEHWEKLASCFGQSIRSGLSQMLSHPLWCAVTCLKSGHSGPLTGCENKAKGEECVWSDQEEASQLLQPPERPSGG